MFGSVNYLGENNSSTLLKTPEKYLLEIVESLLLEK